MSYKVKTPSVVARFPDGHQGIYYEGAPVPEGLSDEEVERLEEGGFIEAVGGAADKPASRSAKK